ncbi:cobyrinate a,c-diamide synthase [Bacteroidota bacterium]
MSYPRIVIGGLSGDSGKTTISCGLIACFKEEGMKISAFKKGPDYIDAAWLGFSAGNPARNLDTYLMGFPTVKKSFLQNASNSEINVIEGNRGLFDGVDSIGTHSTAELAKLLRSPVIIVQNLSKVTRTAAASILGCMNLDPDLNIAGVILNQVAGERHFRIAREAIEETTGIPVVGSIPKLQHKHIIPSRHLGLVTPEEFEQRSRIIRDLRKIIRDNVDILKIIEISKDTPILYDENPQIENYDADIKHDRVKIGYFRDQSFSFYYPENLEMIDKAGAELIPISAFHCEDLEKLDGIYIGGGFPETNLIHLTLNREMMLSLKRLADRGLPIYAECGGLMYLAKGIIVNGKEYSLAGILPIKIEMKDKPQGHGYCEAVVDNENPYYDIGTVIKGHEFHYSRIYEYEKDIKSAFLVSRGEGCFNNRDGIIHNNVFASYFHIHALATPEWADGMIRCARNYSSYKLINNKIIN